MTKDNIQISAIVKEEIASIIGRDKNIERNKNLNADLALSSLQMAQLIVMLENKIGVDPFAEHFVISDMRTVGNVIDAYQQTFNLRAQQ
jgi:acyl carrier protein